MTTKQHIRRCEAPGLARQECDVTATNPATHMTVPPNKGLVMLAG